MQATLELLINLWLMLEFFSKAPYESAPRIPGPILAEGLSLTDPKIFAKIFAAEGIRTPDDTTANESLYRLSHACRIYPLKVFGIIPGRHLHAIPHVRAPNQFTLQVNRRPYNCFCDEQQPSHWNTPRKDKLFILLTSVFSFNIPPASLFTHEGSYEKLRICLEYTGMPTDPIKDVSLIFKRFPGWCTWKVEKRKERSWELLGKHRDEAKCMIINKPCRLPLVFEEIPEPPQVEPSKKKKASKREKRKAKIVEPRAQSPFPAPDVVAESFPPSERRGKFTGKLGKGSIRDRSSTMSLRARVQQEQASKVSMLTKLAEDAKVAEVVKNAGGGETYMKSAMTQMSKLDQPELQSPKKPTSERQKIGISTIKDLKALISLRPQILQSKRNPPTKAGEDVKARRMNLTQNKEGEGNANSTATQVSNIGNTKNVPV
ncbi:hypothetical protein Y032_0036g3351 [Ancylostoma ceylanicum]|nr:hypothetical protein Y032_0036g3351 [Ancylostoma ceylanicum]